MASFEQYSVDAVLNFTVQDIRDLRSPFLDIEGWSDLPPEKRTECLTKLRDLMNREAQTADSIVLDAKRLAAKLRQIPSDPSHRHSSPQSPLSSSEISTPPPLDPQEQEKERLRQENEAYEALIQDGCHPSHPVHRRFDVLDDPGDHKAIVSYWESPPGIGDYLFTTQLNAWRRFRHYQQNIRRHYLQRDQFPHYQEKVRERRRRHGYGGLIQLHPDRQQQSRLDDWMEFQDAQLRCLETLEDDVEQAHMQFESRHRPLEVAAATESEPADKAGDGPFAMAEALALAQNEMAPAQPYESRVTEERLHLLRNDISTIHTPVVKANTPLTGEMRTALSLVASTKAKLERHKILVDWIELKRREMTCDPASPVIDMEDHDKHQQARRASPKGDSSRSGSQALRSVEYSRRSGLQKRQAKACSGLDRVIRSRVSKVSGRKPPPLHQVHNSSDEYQTAEGRPSHHGVARLGNELVSRANETETTALRPIRPSRMYRTGRKQGAKVPAAAAEWPAMVAVCHKKQRLKGPALPVAAARRKVVQKPVRVLTSPRRSPRASRKPERFG